MAVVRTDTEALGTAAVRIRDDAVPPVTTAVIGSRRTEEQHLLEHAFDRYGSLPAYRTATAAWRDELDNLAAALRQLADALETAAGEYRRSDAAAAARLGGVR